MDYLKYLGYKKLMPQEQLAYKIILNAFLSMAASFDCSRIDRNVDLMKIIQTVLGDNPAIVYFDKTKIETIESAFEKQIHLTGVLPKSKVNQMSFELENKANNIISTAKAAAKDEYSLLINIYEYLQSNVRYDKKELQTNSSGISGNSVSHNAFGALINGLAVCDGFSSAFTLLAQKLGFECMLVVGQSMYSASSSVKHGWNIVKVKNRCYHMDVTWDAKKYEEFGEFSYVYFGLHDDEIINDHEWDNYTTPSCSYGDLSYYIKNRLYANNLEQLNDIVKASGQKLDKLIRVKLSRNINFPKNAEEYLTQLLFKEMAVAGKRTQFMYGWDEHTRCFFAKVI